MGFVPFKGDTQDRVRTENRRRCASDSGRETDRSWKSPEEPSRPSGRSA